MRIKGISVDLGPRQRSLLFLGLAILVVGLLMLAIPGKSGGSSQLETKVLSRQYIVTAAYKAYGNEKLGFWLAKTILTNKGSAPVYDVKVSYRVEGFTEWSQPHSYAAIPPQGAVVDLYYPVLPSSITKLTSSTPSKIIIRIEYKPSKNAKPVTKTLSKQVTVLGLNDIVFSDLPPEENTGSFQDAFSNYPLLAAWVTPSDPVILRYAGMAAQLSGGAATSLGDQEAVKFLAAAWSLSVAHGISYQTESAAYWTGKFSEHVKFPRDVLRDRSGTCIDTAIFFAALAMSQGLKAYLVLMPGHAFTIVQLPSGQLLPIETTMLNQKVSFDEAVKMGIRVAQQAFSGPHIVVDIASLQAKGIVPPELPQLPPNILEQWGYSLNNLQGNNNVPGPQPHNNNQNNQNNNNNQNNGGGGGGQVFANTRIPPYWAISLGGEGWQAQVKELNMQGIQGGQAAAVNQQVGMSITVMWIRGASGQQMRMLVEKMFQQQGLSMKVNDEKSINFAGENAQIVLYTISAQGKNIVMVARYFSHNGYGFVVAYMLMSPSNDALKVAESIINTFQWIEGV